MYRDFTNIYSLSKTLRFGLIPQGDTLRNIEVNGILADDADRAEEKKKVQKLADDYQKAFIERALAGIFSKVSSYLAEGGVFVFDVITRKHLARTLADNVFYEDYEDFTLLWLNSYDSSTRTNTAELTLFERQEDGRFARYDGDLVERFYPVQFFIKAAGRAGLKHLGTYDELSYEAPDKDSERVFLVFGKPLEERR